MLVYRALAAQLPLGAVMVGHPQQAQTPTPLRLQGVAEPMAAVVPMQHRVGRGHLVQQ
jgi:hypothetical protein